jgi:N-formylglutamate amidohydrolase
MHQLLENKQYRVEFNRPYAGAYITFNYCQPRKNIYTMQLEINRSLYMDEQSYQKNQRFQSVADHLSSSIEALGYFLLDLKK